MMRRNRAGPRDRISTTASTAVPTYQWRRTVSGAEGQTR
jgi:hypothetical protein